MRFATASRFVLPLPFAVALLLHAGPAEAHLVTTGLGPIYDGILHFLGSFEDLLPAVALALLAGLNGALAGRRALLVLPAAWLLGGTAGYLAGAAPAGGALTAVSAVVVGILVAADRRLPVIVVTVLAALLGAVHGSMNGAGIAIANREATALLGIGAAVFVIVSLLAAMAASVRAPASRVAVRVAGSWIAAVGLLLVGWQMRG